MADDTTTTPTTNTDAGAPPPSNGAAGGGSMTDLANRLSQVIEGRENPLLEKYREELEKVKPALVDRKEGRRALKELIEKMEEEASNTPSPDDDQLVKEIEDLLKED